MTLGDLIYSHGLLFIGLAWAAYLITLAVQYNREEHEANKQAQQVLSPKSGDSEATR